MADKPKTDYNDILCRAIDTIVSKKIENLDYDKTIVCDIVDASDASNGHYIVNDGSISFDAYSEDTGYQANESVYVTVPKGDFTQTKIIVSKYTANNSTDPISYISPLNNIYLVSDNLAQNGTLRHNSILANGRTEEISDTDVYYIPPGRYRLIWEQDLTSSSDSTILNNAVFDTLAVKAKFKCGLGSMYNMKSGHYGLIFELFSVINQDADPIEYRVSRFDFCTDDFFGNPYMFLSYLAQEKTFDISSLGNVVKINVYLYQSSDFKYRETADIADRIVPTPAASADLSTTEGRDLKRQEDMGMFNNIFVEGLEVYFGMDLSKQNDNTFTIYSSSSSTFNVNKEAEYNTKAITPVWFNKTDDGKYIGFSDGIYDYLEAPSDLIGKEYTEDLYINDATYYNSAMKLDQQQLIDKGVPAVKELLFIYSYGQKMQALLDKIYSRLSVNLNRCYERLMRDLYSYQNTDQRENTQNAYINVISAEDAYGQLLQWLTTIKADEDTENSLMNKILTALQVYGNKYINRSSTLPINQANITWQGLINIINQLASKLDAAETQGCYHPTDSYFNIVKNNTDSGVLIIWENWYKSCEQVFQDCEDFISQLRDIVGDAQNNTVGTIYHQLLEVQHDFESNIYTDFETEYNDFVSMYANRYCIYWYRYVDNYLDPDEKFMPKGWQRITQLTNMGLPDEYFTGDTSDKMFAIRASNPTFTYTIGDASLRQERIQAVLFYDHQQFKSNILIFYNEEAVVDQSTKDAIDGLYIQITDEILSKTQIDDKGNPVVEQADTYNSKETYQLYDISNYLANPAEAYKKRKIRARYQGGVKGDDYLKHDCIIYWYLPLTSTMLTYSRDDLLAAGFSIYDPSYKPGFGSVRREDYMMEQDYLDALAELEALEESYIPELPAEPYGSNYKEGYMMAWRTIDMDEREQLVVESTEFIYQIKKYYVPTFTNNTIKCKVVKRSQYVYEAEQLFTFASLGSNGTDYSLTITPASNQAAVMNSQVLPLYVRLFDHNGDEVTDIMSGNMDFELYGKSYNGYLESPPINAAGGVPYAFITRVAATNASDEPNDYGYAVLHATANVEIVYNKEDIVANNEPTVSISDYETLAGTKTDEQVSDDPIKKTITLEAYYPIPWCADPDNMHPQGYYIEGASVIVYDSFGSNPTYYSDPFVLYDMATNAKIANQVWSIQCYPSTDYTKTTLISSYMPKIKVVEYKDENDNVIDRDYCLQVSNMYLDDNDYVCSAVCKVNGIITYVQPILVIKNRFSSPMLNAWDGELTIDKKNGTILSSMVGAGKKNKDNTFSGVLMGEVASKTDINTGTVETGLFGFNHGEQAFGFKDDGTAFLGKAGRGRIEFDGNHGEISSSAYKRAANDASRTGMMIDLDDAWIDMRGGYILNTQSNRWNPNIDESQNNNEVNRNANTTYDTNTDDFVNLTRYGASGSKVLISATSPFLKVITPDKYYYLDEYIPGMTEEQVKVAACQKFWNTVLYYKDLDSVKDYLQGTWDIFDAIEYYNTTMTLGATNSGTQKNAATFLSELNNKTANGYFLVNENLTSSQITEIIPLLVDLDGNGFNIAYNDGTAPDDKVLYQGDFLFYYLEGNNKKLLYVPKNTARIDKIADYPNILPAFAKGDGTKRTSISPRVGTDYTLSGTLTTIAQGILNSRATANSDREHYANYDCIKFLTSQDYARCIMVFGDGTKKFDGEHQQGETILEVGMDQYYMQTDNFIRGTKSAGYADGKGLKFDLMGGSLEAYNFDLFAANPDDANGNLATYVRLSSNGDPFFEVTRQGKELMKISTSEFLMHSQNWEKDLEGTEINLTKGKFTSYDFNLVAYGRNGDAVDKTTFVKLASGGNPYFQIRHQGKDLLNIGHSKFILQSKNWNNSGNNKAGIQFDLERGRLTGYNFYLRMVSSVSGENISSMPAESGDGTSNSGQGGEIILDSGNASTPLVIKSNAQNSKKVFKVYWDGQVAATAGVIGGWRINETALWSHGTTAGVPNDFSFRLDAHTFSRALTNFGNKNNLKIAIGKKFAVDQDGTLYANEGNFRGYIYASAGGTIGGWTITDEGLKNSTNTINITPSKLKYGSNFEVDSNGNVTCHNLTADTGIIGKWVLNASGFSSTATSGNNAGTITGGYISGSLISGATVVGGKILGGTLDIGSDVTENSSVGSGNFTVANTGAFSVNGTAFSVSNIGYVEIGVPSANALGRAEQAGFTTGVAGNMIIGGDMAITGNLYIVGTSQLKLGNNSTISIMNAAGTEALTQINNYGIKCRYLQITETKNGASSETWFSNNKYTFSTYYFSLMISDNQPTSSSHWKEKSSIVMTANFAPQGGGTKQCKVYHYDIDGNVEYTGHYVDVPLGSFSKTTSKVWWFASSYTQSIEGLINGNQTEE